MQSYTHKTAVNRRKTNIGLPWMKIDKDKKKKNEKKVKHCKT